jgi:erythrocyte band 7 integral membrane protein
MQIRTLESLQSMAKSANSKVIFVPMNLNSDVAVASGSGYNNGGGLAYTSNIQQMADM